MKARRIGEIAKIKPALMNGTRFIGKVLGTKGRSDTLLIRQRIVSIELQIKDHPSSAEVVFYLFRD